MYHPQRTVTVSSRRPLRATERNSLSYIAFGDTESDALGNYFTFLIVLMPPLDVPPFPFCIGYAILRGWKNTTKKLLVVFLVDLLDKW